MGNDRDDALEAFLAAFDKRLEAAPVIERRDRPDRRAHPFGTRIDGRRTDGPVKDPFAYWESGDKKPDPKD